MDKLILSNLFRICIKFSLILGSCFIIIIKLKLHYNSKMKEHLDIKSESTDGSRIGKYHWFKKKSEQKKHESSDVNL